MCMYSIYAFVVEGLAYTTSLIELVSECQVACHDF
jgi:hypothetical protein